MRGLLWRCRFNLLFGCLVVEVEEVISGVYIDKSWTLSCQVLTSRIVAPDVAENSSDPRGTVTGVSRNRWHAIP